MPWRRGTVAAALVLPLLALGTRALASEPTIPEAPLLHPGVSAGTLAVADAPARRPAAHSADGNLADWVGTATRYGGTAAYSKGEYIYTDHLFDAYGADDGRDAQRERVLDALANAAPSTYRLEPLFQANLPGEVGAPNPGPLDVQEHYGDAPMQAAADLRELRLAADANTLHVLARTTTMRTATDTAVVLLIGSGGPSRPVPFNAGITTGAPTAVFLTGDGHSSAVDLATGRVTALPSVVAVPDGWANAIEADVPLRAVGLQGSKTATIAAATGTYDATAHAFKTLQNETSGAPLGANLANVAFRFAEPVRIWWDKDQATALLGRSIDRFSTTVDLKKLVAGGNQTWAPKPGGYFDRIFESDPAIATESGEDGIAQHYGVWVPSSYGGPSGAPTPAMFWMHWRGGKAHSAATEVPRVMRDFGDERGAFVFSPFGRGDSTWYLGRGQADVREVWDDAMATFKVDPDRVYIGGHSMGGWAAWLFSTTMPDRFAAAFPDEGPVTQGAYTGADFQGCDNYTYQEYSFCFVQANNGNARQEWSYRLLPNLRNVPVAVYQGVEDELVPVSGVVVQMNRVRDLGYRYRLYLFPVAEHYTHPVLDEWQEAARYLFAQKRVANPPHVTYVRDMPFEHAVGNGPDLRPGHTAGLSFPLDHAYWMSELTPRDPANGQAQFDGFSLAIRDQPHLALPEAGGPESAGQNLPWVMTGQQWVADPTKQTPPASNAFTASLTGARAVRLDMAQMKIDVSKAVHGTVTTDGMLTLRLAGAWQAPPVVIVDGAPVAAALSGGVLSIAVPAGTHVLGVGG